MLRRLTGLTRQFGFTSHPHGKYRIRTLRDLRLLTGTQAGAATAETRTAKTMDTTASTRSSDAHEETPSAEPTESRQNLSRQGQSAREFLELDDMMRDLVVEAALREADDKKQSLTEQYTHPGRTDRASDSSSADCDEHSESGSTEKSGPGPVDSETEATESEAEARSPERILREIDELETLIEAAGDAISPASCSLAGPLPEHPRVQAFAWPSAVTTEPCLVCGNTTALRKFAIEGVTEQLVECQSCGLGSLFPMPSAARIQSFYPAEYYGTPSAKFEPLVEAGVRAGARARVRSLLAGIRPESQVLDIGCGRGVMLRAALDLGHTAHGVEISEEAAAGVDPRAHIRIASDLNQAGYETHSMDVVILWHVLEHLPQPGRTLAEIRRILTPGGRLVLAVPNYASWQSRWAGADWFHLDLPRHLFHFTPDTLSLLLRRNGFANQSVRHFAALQNPFGWLQSWFNRADHSARNSLYSLLHRGGDHEDVREMSGAKRLFFKAAFAAGLPVAGAVSLVEAAFRQGGTIAVTAETGCIDDNPSPAFGIRPELLAGAC